MITPKEACVGFSHCLGIGPMRFSHLIVQFGNAETAYLASEAELVPVIGKNTAHDFVAFRHRFDATKKIEEIEKKGIGILTREESGYPEPLLQISDPPICIYIKGNRELFDTHNYHCFGLVGSRKPTNYGLWVARKFAAELAAVGMVIVSGMAYGIDAVSHIACLDTHGKTIAVLGCGVDLPYPVQHTFLYNRILENGGAIISEFPPGNFVQKGLFISRNRLISGISQGIMVVEGSSQSGSLSTARYAAEQGKTVFAPPVPLNSQVSEAPLILLKEGAILVTKVEDILDGLGLTINSISSSKKFDNLSLEEQKIVALLQQESFSADSLCLQAKIDIDVVLKLLLLLEMRGIVVKNANGSYTVG
ncbi:DNA-protecting protein DprA [Candidatus Roizmanbacteria bacterium]|nr:DNA-protecting protein DprA [Candidatus Roizmanbacteria bacterium]